MLNPENPVQKVQGSSGRLSLGNIGLRENKVDQIAIFPCKVIVKGHQCYRCVSPLLVFGLKKIILITVIRKIRQGHYVPFNISPTNTTKPGIIVDNSII